MRDDDQDFFILVLGVLAAIVMLVSWWALRSDVGTTTSAAVAVASDADAEAAHSHDDDDHSHDHDDDDHSHDDDDHSHDDDDRDDNLTPVCPSGWELDDDTGLCVDVTDSSDDSADEAASATDGDEADTLAEPLAATIADLVSGDPELSELAALLDADTIAALGGEGPFTLLAPSNEAIAALDPAERAVVLGDARRGGTLAYHLLPERLDAATIDELFARGSRSPEVITAQGEPVTVTVDDGDIQINGASVSRSDLIAGNGVVHVIDQVLVPRETALNAVVALEPIQFASGSATIDPASEATLDRVAEQLLATDVAVTVEGHTDNQGDPALNQALSLDRARAVVNYLVAAGVDESRLGFEGFGETDPVATNDTDEGRALNRRIEFRIDN